MVIKGSDRLKRGASWQLLVQYSLSALFGDSEIPLNRKQIYPRSDQRHCQSMAARKTKKHYGSPSTERFDMKLFRENLNPSQIFWTFFLLGAAFAALLQLFLLNLSLLIVLPQGLDRPSVSAAPALWLFGLMEVSGAIEAVLVFLFGLPPSFLIAVFAMSSYLVLRRVNFVAVLAAVFAAISLENIFAPDTYNGYFASHSVRGPWLPGGEGAHPRQAVLLQWLLHLVPVLICWWLVRNRRLPPL